MTARVRFDKIAQRLARPTESTAGASEGKDATLPKQTLAFLKKKKKKAPFAMGGNGEKAPPFGAKAKGKGGSPFMFGKKKKKPAGFVAR